MKSAISRKSYSGSQRRRPGRVAPTQQAMLISDTSSIRQQVQTHAVVETICRVFDVKVVTILPMGIKPVSDFSR
jgi:hypothetical protein